MSMVGGWKRSQTLIFTKTSEVTRSKWLITLMIDLKPYNVLADELGVPVTKLERVRAQVVPKYTSNVDYPRIYIYIYIYSFRRDRQLFCF